MNTVAISLFIIAFMPLILATFTLPVRIKNFGKVDLYNPRAQAAKFEGLGARLINAQSNAWEALGLYAAAILAMLITQADLNSIQIPVIIFVIARILHAILFAMNKARFRFYAFVAASSAIMWIFVVAMMAL